MERDNAALEMYLTNIQNQLSLTTSQLVAESPNGQRVAGVTEGVNWSGLYGKPDFNFDFDWSVIAAFNGIPWIPNQTDVICKVMSIVIMFKNTILL